MQASVIVVGAGYTGARLAAALHAAAHPVWLTRRSTAAATALAATIGPDVHGLGVALPDAAALAAAPPDATWVVLAPPVDAAGTLERAVLDAARAPRHVVYVSSTGVYGPAAGAWVDETAPIAPFGPSGVARVAAERVVTSSGVPWTILRPAGIYGPGRGLVARLRAGSYRVVGDGTTMVSRIHVDDLVAALVAAIARPGTGRIYNVADDEPTTAGGLADELARRLGLPPPPRIAAADASAEQRAMLTADRRIANRRLRDELGVQLRFPSWRDGMAGDLAEAFNAARADA